MNSSFTLYNYPKAIESTEIFFLPNNTKLFSRSADPVRFSQLKSPINLDKSYHGRFPGGHVILFCEDSYHRCSTSVAELNLLIETLDSEWNTYAN